MIEVIGLSFSYGRKQILKDISFSFSQGECVAVLGDNGAGKSTLITCLNRIRRAQSGQVSIDGTQILKMPPSELARNVSYVAQKNEQNHITVFDAVLLGRKPYIRWAALEEDLNIAENALEAIGLGSMKRFKRILCWNRWKAAKSGMSISICAVSWNGWNPLTYKIVSIIAKIHRPSLIRYKIMVA